MPVNLRCKRVSYDIMTKTAVCLFERSLEPGTRGVFQVAGFVKTLSCLTLKTGKLLGFRSRKRGNETFW